MGSCTSRLVSHHPPTVDRPKLQHFIPLVLPQSGSKDESFFDAEACLESDCDDDFCSSDEGCKEELFFDAESWLETDSDDDFYSVDGDYTPSSGDTPINHRYSTETPLVRTPSNGNTGTPRLVKINSKPFNVDTPPHVNLAAGTLQSNEVVKDKEPPGYIPEISAVENRKRLFELFQLSRGGFARMNVSSLNTSIDAKTVSGTVFTSVTSRPSTAISFRSSKRSSKASIKSQCTKALKSVHPTRALRKIKSFWHRVISYLFA